MTTMHRSAFSTPRTRPNDQTRHYHLFEVVVDGQLMGQMQYHPHRRKWKCVRFHDGAHSLQRNRRVAHQWIQETN